MISRHQAIEGFRFATESDFKGPDGDPPAWAEGHPKVWGDENARIVLPLFDEQETAGSVNDRLERSRLFADVAGDGKLLAVSNEHTIWVYDLETKQLRQRISRSPVEDSDVEIDGVWLFSSPPTHDSSPPSYTLVCSTDQGRVNDSSIVFYELDADGRLTFEPPKLDDTLLADEAVKSIQDHLLSDYGWAKEDLVADRYGLKTGFKKVLADAGAKSNLSSRTVLSGTIATFGSRPIDSTGRKLLYIENNTSTQHKMRPPDKLPHVVIYDMAAKEAVIRLSGHTDAIMWVGFSPDDSLVASVAWDGSVRVCSATNGQLMWASETGTGQAWAAAFAPDGRHLVVSSHNGRTVSVHRVSDGTVMCTFEDSKPAHWIRHFAWHPSGESVALAWRSSAMIWEPFREPPLVTQKYSLGGEGVGKFGAFFDLSIKWLDNKMVLLECTDGTSELWDSQRNLKWRMLKPQGTIAGSAKPRHFLLNAGGKDAGHETLISVDGDGIVRFWDL